MRKAAAIRAGRVIILEFKPACNVRALDEKCNEALKQTDDNQYVKPSISEGYPVIQKYGISFYKKDCMVKTEQPFAAESQKALLF